MNGVRRAGECFGENALFTNQAAKICVKTKAKDTAVMSLTKAKFNRIKHEGKFVHEDMMAKIEKLQSESEEQIIAHTFSSTDANGNAVIDRAEAEKWLRRAAAQHRDIGARQMAKGRLADMDVVVAISKVQTKDDTPIKPIMMRSITISGV